MFQELGTPLWVQRVTSELERTNVSPARDIAAKLFVSTKTVEANLTQVYRKLAVHSRAELGRVMSQ